MAEARACEEDPEAEPLRLTRPIALVGLMGAGKTTVGRRLATRLRVRFLDSDQEIVKAAGMTIAEIFETYGEPDFRNGERRVIARLLDGGPCVLATGGGAFVQPDTRAEIRARATSVWLRASLDLLWDRVRDRPGRPLLATADPRAVLADLERRRRDAYAEADVIVDSRRGATHDTMARVIVAAVREHDAQTPDRPPALEPIPR